MSNRPDWTEWILQKNNEAQKEQLKKNEYITLNKAVPKNGSYGPAGEYHLDLTKPEGQYTGADLRRMQVNTIKNARQVDPNSVKKMINPETGKHEDHLAVHFGTDKYDEHYKSPWNRNEFKLKDNKVELSSSNGGVVSQDPEYSGGNFAGADYDNKKQNYEPRLFSFWVPMSKIHTDFQHNGGPNSGYHRLMPGEQVANNRALNLQMLERDREEWTPKRWEDGEDNPPPPRGISDMSYKVHTPEEIQEAYHTLKGVSEQAEEYGHTHIFPGTYEPIAPEDMKKLRYRSGENYGDSRGNGDNGKSKDRVMNIHRITFPHFYDKK